MFEIDDKEFTAFMAELIQEQSASVTERARRDSEKMGYAALRGLDKIARLPGNGLTSLPDDAKGEFFRNCNALLWGLLLSRPAVQRYLAWMCESTGRPLTPDELRTAVIKLLSIGKAGGGDRT